MTNPIRVGIYGSCVSRDTFSVLSPPGYYVKLYVARNSVVSIDTDARDRYPEDLGLTSEFQRRQVELDASGMLWNRLERSARKLDVFLWDLVDERHGFVRFPDGSYVTRSVETMSQPGLTAVLEQGDWFSFGTDRHFAVWQLAADRFVQRLVKNGLFERTLLVAVPWAEQMADGRPSPSSMGVTAGEANARYERYYSHLAALRIPSVTSVNPLANSTHRWGPAPFHYQRSVYESILAGLDAFVASRSGAVARHVSDGVT